MTCDERKDLLLLYAAGQLEPAEREALRAHLSTGCPACAGNLAEAEAIVSQLATNVTPIAPPPTAVDALMRRIGSESDRRPAATAERSWWTRPLVSTLVAAGVAVLVTTAVLLHVTRDARSFWRSSSLTTVALNSPTQPNARGQVWWDRERQQWRVTVRDLAPAPAGREYELWFIPQGGTPMRSQTFQVGRDGTSEFVVAVPPEVGDLATAAITDEPLGGTDAPTGKIHLAGQFR